MSGDIAAAEESEVFLTGASGFVGSHVLRSLLAANYRVRALMRSGARPLPPLDRCTPVPGDLLRPGELIRHMEGCRYLVHAAALYTFSPEQRRAIWTTNVRGTAGLLEAARIAGIERAVVTSSSATVGPARGAQPATEADWAEAHERDSQYHTSKMEQERVALAAQLPVVLVLPTAPFGPGDWKPTPTGTMVVDFMRGRIFASLAGGVNAVAVEDVARAHVLALQRGRAGERYLIGGENLSLTELWTRLATICGRKAPTRRLPYHAAMALAWSDELRCRLAARTGSPTVPSVPLEGVRMARHCMFVSDQKARAELGHWPTSVNEALERAVRWFHDHGYAT